MISRLVSRLSFLSRMFRKVDAHFLPGFALTRADVEAMRRIW